MNVKTMMPALVAVVALAACSTTKQEPMTGEKKAPELQETFFLPGAEASKVVSVTNEGPAAASIVVQTQRVAVKETGPKETVAKFGEIYDFSPAFIAVHRDEPTRIRFWNLQGDDNHDFMLMSPRSEVLMKVLLPPLQETSYVFTFHEEGLYNFVCAMHQPSMLGQILVLPPQSP
jgi:plastocyanin